MFRGRTLWFAALLLVGLTTLARADENTEQARPLGIGPATVGDDIGTPQEVMWP